MQEEKVSAVILMKDKSGLKFKQQAEGLFIYVENVQLDDVDTIIQVTLQ